jgi:hypothetical protein
MAALSRSKGDDWLAQGDAADRVQRLVDTILQGLQAPASFSTQAQEMPSGSTLAWLALWQKRDRQPERIAPWLAGVPSVPTLGGDLSLMARRPW